MAIDSFLHPSVLRRYRDPNEPDRTMQDGGKAHRPSDTVRSVCIGIVLLERPGLLMAVPVLLTLSSSQVCLLWQEPLIAQLPQPQPQLWVWGSSSSVIYT